MSRRIVKSWKWRFRSRPAALWPILSDLERLHEALGLPRYRLRETIGEDGLRKRFGEYDTDDDRMRWEEPYYEWAAPSWWRWEKLYESGPIEFARATLLLEDDRNGGTDATYTLETEPRGMLGKWLLRTGHLRDAARDLEAIARRADTHAAKPLGDFYANLFSGRAKVKPFTSAERSALLATAGEDDREVLGALIDWAGIAPLADVAALEPKRIARALGLRQSEALDLCFAATEAGLLEPRFQLLCRECRAVIREAPLPGDLPDEQGCPRCAAPSRRDLAETVVLVFLASSRLRAPSSGVFCASSPGLSPNTILQQTLDPRERRALPMQLDPGTAWRGRVHDVGATADFELPEASGVTLRAGADWIGEPDEGAEIVLENHADHPLTFRIERAGLSVEATRASAAAMSRRWFDWLCANPRGLREAEYVGFGSVLAAGSPSPALTGAAGEIVGSCHGVLSETPRDTALLVFAVPEDADRAAAMMLERLPECRIGIDHGELVFVMDGETATFQGTAREYALRLRDRSVEGEPIRSDAFLAVSA